MQNKCFKSVLFICFEIFSSNKNINMCTRPAWLNPLAELPFLAKHGVVSYPLSDSLLWCFLSSVCNNFLKSLHSFFISCKLDDIFSVYMQWLWYNAYSNWWSRDLHLFLYSALICWPLCVVEGNLNSNYAVQHTKNTVKLFNFLEGGVGVIYNSQCRHNQSFLLKKRKAYYPINVVSWSWLPRLTWKTTHYISSLGPTLCGHKVFVDKK